jgi:hypothetical protein
MQDEAEKRRMDEIRAMVRELGTWPDDWGDPMSPELLDLYDLLAEPYRAAGRPFGDSLEGLVRWWHECQE